MVDRKTVFLFMRKLENGKKADGVYKAMVSVLEHYKLDVQTITSDNGTEFARHKDIAVRLKTDFYQIAQKAPSLRARMDSADGAAVLAGWRISLLLFFIE